MNLHLPVRRVAVRCPFCLGNEGDTPAALAVYPDNAKASAKNGSPHPWQVRVVPNRYPAVKCDLPAPSVSDPYRLFESLQTSVTGFGVHEVIIESADHAVSYTDLTDEQASLALVAYRDRMSALRKDPRIAYAQIFKNVGAAGGASIEHAHSQLIGLSFVPGDVKIELDLTRDWLEKTQRCVFCRMIDEELALGVRIVDQSENFVAFCPYAGRFPYETWVLPRQHASHYELGDKKNLPELASFLKNIIGRIERVTHQEAYNYLLHSAPFDSTNLPHYHWHFEIFPRVTTSAGFEWGTGFFINPMPPEEGAAALRECKLAVA